MVKKNFKINWSNESKVSVKEIYDFYKNKSLQGAKNVIKDIINSPKSIIYAEQFQIDDINPKYRRIIVRDYKVLYRIENNVVNVVDVICTRKDPNSQTIK